MMDSTLQSLLVFVEIPRWFLGMVFGSGFFAYYYMKVVQPPTFSCLPGQYREFLELNVPLVKEKFWPTIWCFESRFQTVLASVLRKKLDVRYSREVINLSDGGRVAIDWVDSELLPPETPVILILPGLTGSSRTDYVRGLATTGKKAGFRCVVFNNRGVGGLRLLTPVTYCASKTNDVATVIKHIKQMYPNAPLAATGVSMGGLILGNYLSTEEEIEQGLISAAMMISVPFDIFKATYNMERPGLNSLLNRHLVSCLREVIQGSQDILGGHDKPWKLNEVINSRTVREFDSNFTSKVFGYKTAEEYYTDASLCKKFANIKTPLLCLNAADDPFQPVEDESDRVLEHDRTNIALVLTARGGHIAFMEGIWPSKGGEEYMDRFFTQFFTAILRDNTFERFITD